jgi:NDP-sugar pyrophosphorylase family protein
VVLAAGAGTRLRPLTDLRPKALCPVGNRPLLDWALERVRPYCAELAVNVHHHRDQLLAHLAGADVHVSLEEPRALGTAGALGRLRDWVAGRPLLLANADAWSPRGVSASARLVEGWAGDSVRLLCVRDPARADFGDARYVGTALLPWWSVRDLAPVPSGLYEVSWRRLYDEGRVELVVDEGPHLDCGTPASYLHANLAASGGASVVEPGAVVEGELVRSVVWAGSHVGPQERLVEVVRAGDLTVPAGSGAAAAHASAAAGPSAPPTRTRPAPDGLAQPARAGEPTRHQSE